MELFLTITLLCSGFAVTYASNCKEESIKSCVEDIKIENVLAYDSSVQEFTESCGKKMDAVKCVNDFVNRCLSVYNQTLFRAAVGGQMKLIEDRCTAGTELNAIFLKNMECFGKVSADISDCDAKFTKSQTIITESSLDPSKKHFHGCCSFDWWNKCKTRSVEEKCDSDAVEDMNQISDTLAGQVLTLTCSPIIMGGFENCFGLYGVEGKAHLLNASLLVPLLCFILLRIKHRVG